MAWPYDSNPLSGITMDVVSSGQYNIHVPVSLTGGNVQVTGYYLGESNRDRCKVAYWNATEGIRVNCHDLNGAAPKRSTLRRERTDV